MKLSISLITLVTVCLLAVPRYTAAIDDDQMKVLCTEKKDADQCFSMGEKYRVVDMNNTAALEYFTLGCNLDHMTSCVHEGILTQEKGAQNSPEWKRAAELFQKACDQHHDKGCFELATLKYREGRAKKAVELYHLACEYGNKIACANEKKLTK